jgi:D-sedoheptulose 7-phosphate isomerase
MNYLADLVKQINAFEIKKVNKLIAILKIKQKQRKKFFICGNGGSAANANHISNDLMLGFTKNKIGFPLLSLSSNIAKISCIGNDVGYEKIFSNQLKVLGNKGDLLIILSGSGNSKNIIEVAKQAKKMKIYVFGLIGFDGGMVKNLLNSYIHFKSNDMQICEDMQMIFMNYVLKKISNQKFKF